MHENEKNTENLCLNESTFNTSAVNNINNKSGINRSSLIPIKIDKELRGSFIDNIDKKPIINKEKVGQIVYEGKKQSVANCFPENFTVIFLGQRAVGKSAIISRLLNKGFNLEYDETILDTYCCEMGYDFQEENKEKDFKNKKSKKELNEQHIDNSLLFNNLNFDNLENYKYGFSSEKIYEKETENTPPNNIKSNDTKQERYTFMAIDTGDFETNQNDIEDLFNICNCIVFVYSIDVSESFRKIVEIYFKIKEKNTNIKNFILVGNKNDLNIYRNVSFFQAVEFAESHNIKFLEASAKDEINIHKIFQTFVDFELKRNPSKQYSSKSENDEFCKCF